MELLMCFVMVCTDRNDDMYTLPYTSITEVVNYHKWDKIFWIRERTDPKWDLMFCSIE